MANQPNGTLDTGVTADLVKRVWQHKQHLFGGFTRKYDVDVLVWYELHETTELAIRKEKAIKNWKREWKIRTIEARNPSWDDLYSEVVR